MDLALVSVRTWSALGTRCLCNTPFKTKRSHGLVQIQASAPWQLLNQGATACSAWRAGEGGLGAWRVVIMWRWVGESGAMALRPVVARRAPRDGAVRHAGPAERAGATSPVGGAGQGVGAVQSRGSMCLAAHRLGARALGAPGGRVAALEWSQMASARRAAGRPGVRGRGPQRLREVKEWLE